MTQYKPMVNVNNFTEMKITIVGIIYYEKTNGRKVNLNIFICCGNDQYFQVKSLTLN